MKYLNLDKAITTIVHAEARDPKRVIDENTLHPNDPTLSQENPFKCVTITTGAKKEPIKSAVANDTINISKDANLCCLLLIRCMISER